MPAGHLLAVDIGASKTLVVVLDREALARGWPATVTVDRIDSPRDPVALVDWVVGIVGALDGAAVTGIGVAAPGPVDVSAGVIRRSSNLGWEDVPIAAMLRDRLVAPTFIEDDANAAAYGEWRFGAGAQADPFAYLTISSGVGGGVVAGGALVRGSRGNAGEVGHIVVDVAGPPCACGRRGDVEAYAGGSAMARRAAQAWPGGRTSDGSVAPADAAGVYAAARSGDPTAERLVDEATNAVATAMASFAAVLEPARLAVGGSIGLNQPDMVRAAAARARDRVMAENGRSLDVRPAELGEQSVLAGAAALALQRGGDT